MGVHESAFLRIRRCACTTTRTRSCTVSSVRQFTLIQGLKGYVLYTCTRSPLSTCCSKNPHPNFVQQYYYTLYVYCTSVPSKVRTESTTYNRTKVLPEVHVQSCTKVPWYLRRYFRTCTEVRKYFRKHIQL